MGVEVKEKYARGEAGAGVLYATGVLEDAGVRSGGGV